MNAVIWKFTLALQGECVIRMPQYSEVLSVQVQRGVPCVWAKVNPSNQLVAATFKIVATGVEFEMSSFTPGDYLSTFQLSGGDLVFHVFGPRIVT